MKDAEVGQLLAADRRDGVRDDCRRGGVGCRGELADRFTGSDKPTELFLTLMTQLVRLGGRQLTSTAGLA